MSSTQELACVYAALILQDDNVAITAEKIQSITSAAGVDVEPFWAGLFAKSLEGVDVKKLITNISSGVGGDAPAVAPTADSTPAAAAAAAPVVEKKEEPKEDESDEDMGFGLFD